MAAIVTRAVKGSALTHVEVDANFNNLNAATLSPDRHSIRPSLLLDFANTRQLDPRITFARASTATYYDGKTTAMAEQNLLLYSQDLTQWWGKSNITAVGNTTLAPDSTTTGQQIVENATTNTHNLTLGANTSFLSGNTYVFSVYAKIGVGATAPSYIQMYANNFISSAYANFNLSTGVVSSSSGITASAISIGNGWFRLIGIITATSTASTGNIGICFNNNNASATYAPTYAGAITSDVYLWGFQLEQRSAVTAYIPTTTAPITNYIPALQTAASGVARFDCNPTTSESLGLLIEEQRTNLLTYSDDFSNAYWVKTRAIVTSNIAIAPDGTLTGDKLSADTSSATTHRLNGTGTLSATGYTTSIYAKKAEFNYLSILLNSIANSATWFDLNLGTVSTLGSSVTATITNVGNGWYRCSITGTSTAGTGDVTIYPADTNGSANTTIANGYSGIYIWGAQLEAGSFATSYIPTVASQVTRVPDDAKITGANFTSWYNQSQGTVYVSAIAPPVNSCGLVSINDATNSNRMTAQSLSPTSMLYRYVSSSGNFSSSGTTYTANSTIKTAFVYKQNDQAGYTNTIADTGITNQPSLPIVTQMQIGLGPSVLYAAIPISKIAYYPKRLTNAELQGITS